MFAAALLVQQRALAVCFAADAALIIPQQYQLCNILMIITGMYDNSFRKISLTVGALITLVQ